MKIILSIVLLFSFAKAIEPYTILKEVDNLPYSFDKRIRILKRIGMEYCIGEGKYYERKEFNTQSFWLHWFEGKLELYDNNSNFFRDSDDFVKFKAFIDKKVPAQSIFPKLYTCLELYDSKEYEQEAERIVKKYCKDCK